MYHHLCQGLSLLNLQNGEVMLSVLKRGLPDHKLWRGGPEEISPPAVGP